MTVRCWRIAASGGVPVTRPLHDLREVSLVLVVVVGLRVVRLVVVRGARPFVLRRVVREVSRCLRGVVVRRVGLLGGAGLFLLAVGLRARLGRARVPLALRCWVGGRCLLVVPAGLRLGSFRRRWGSFRRMRGSRWARPSGRVRLPCCRGCSPLAFSGGPCPLVGRAVATPWASCSARWRPA